MRLGAPPQDENGAEPRYVVRRRSAVRSGSLWRREPAEESDLACPPGATDCRLWVCGRAATQLQSTHSRILLHRTGPLVVA
jgi:hypothetical protein